ncbi:hypothetical protein ANO11243_013480 [Dothideomycetidae sp. 11243]|nr:hypothetical protein ANO11243_013480 [fungal sp. No.11243]
MAVGQHPAAVTAEVTRRVRTSQLSEPARIDSLVRLVQVAGFLKCFQARRIERNSSRNAHPSRHSPSLGSRNMPLLTSSSTRPAAAADAPAPRTLNGGSQGAVNVFCSSSLPHDSRLTIHDARGCAASRTRAQLPEESDPLLPSRR